MINVNKCFLVGLSVFMFNTAFASDNRIIEITSIYKDSLMKDSIETCANTSPLYILAAVAVTVEQLIPDDVKEKFKFKTSFFDIESKYKERDSFVGEYEVLGTKNPFSYKVVFSVANTKSKEYFRVENISGSLVDTLKKSQAELISGLCGSYQKLKPKSVASIENDLDEELLTFVKGEYPNDYSAQQYIYNLQLDAKKYMATVSDDEVKEIAYREYPSDYLMQKNIYNMELDAKKYMATVSDDEVKEIAYREYPSDYSTQKYIYNTQLAAKKYMATVSDDEVKEIAYRKYPSDYSTQKYIYNLQLAAKEYMATVINSSEKSKAIKEYPKDYVTQKNIYGRSSK